MQKKKKNEKEIKRRKINGYLKRIEEKNKEKKYIDRKIKKKKKKKRESTWCI